MFANSPTRTICSTTPLTELRKCRVCSLEKSACEYSGSVTDCRRCRSEAERLRRRRKRLRAASDAARQLVQAEDIASIQAVASKLTERFGPRRLAALFQELLVTARPGSSAVANGIIGVLRLQLLAESLSANLEPTDSLESTKRALARELTGFVLEHPHTAAGLLRELGWRVEPPECECLSPTNPQPEVTYADQLLPMAVAKALVATECESDQ